MNFGKVITALEKGGGTVNGLSPGRNSQFCFSNGIIARVGEVRTAEEGIAAV